MDDFELKNEKIQELIRRLGSKLKAEMPPHWGFALIVASYGDGGMFYISSIERAGMIKLYKEAIVKLEEKIN